MVEQTEQAIQQTTIVLPYFHDEVLVLYLQDGRRYVPVVVLCRMFGLRADLHIRHWRKLMLWYHARKLSWRTPTGRTRMV